MSKVSYYTAEGLKKLKDELNQLRDIERPKASQAIAEARDKEICLKTLNTTQQKKLKVSWSLKLLKWKRF